MGLEHDGTNPGPKRGRLVGGLPSVAVTREVHASQPLKSLARVAAALALVASVACRSNQASTPAGSGAETAAARGGQLAVSIKGEPQSFNWFIKHDISTELLTYLTHAKLVRINHATGELEAWLAESWTRSDDGLRYTLKLRPTVTFADGTPFTADDVAFSFAAAYDREGGSVVGDSLQVGGRNLSVRVVDPLTVTVTFPAPFGPGLRLLDNLPIYPKHKLQQALAAGAFATAWSLSTPVSEVTGLGPFVIAEYMPGQRIVFSRNPHYFRRDKAGQALPYLDRIVAEVVPDQEAELLRLQSGELDMTASEVRPEDYSPLKRLAAAGRMQLLDLGPSNDPESLWFNLKPGAFAADHRAAWLQRDELRQAISLAVDRRLFVDTVYLGAGVPVFGPVTPANRIWYSTAAVPQPTHDPARAKTLLAAIGLTDRDGDHMVEDSQGRPARFTMLTQKGQTALERGTAVIRDELKKIGLLVDVVPLERNAVIQRFLTGRDYEAVYFHIGTSDTDPAVNLDFWLSSGGSHVWNLMQPTPVTPWERAIDELMTRQIATSDPAERKRIFDQVQRIFAEHVPIIHFAAPNVFVAASSRVVGMNPAVGRPQLLWSADTLAVRR